MGKFYYVGMLNPIWYYIETKHMKTETGKLLENVAGNISLGSYQPSALAIYGVKKETKQKLVDGFFGHHWQKYIDYDPFFMICEDKGNYLSEVITGYNYAKGDSNNWYSEKLRIETVREVTPTAVANLLKSLSRDEIQRYCNGINNLNVAIRNGYYKDMERMRNETIQKQADEDFVRNFKRTYKR